MDTSPSIDTAIDAPAAVPALASAPASTATDALLPSQPRERVEWRLRWLFGAALLARLLYPFYNSPLSHIWSDPQRHWENGQRLFDPGFMGSCDPIMYQVWVFLLQQLKGGNAAAVIASGTGLLCAAMPYGWYRAFKELMPRDWALAGGILMALVPAFTGIYGYFMNETLLLTLTGFAFWATFRAHRKRSVDAFSVACMLWLAAGFTRTTALPMGLLCLLSIWLPQPQKLLKAGLGLAMLLTIAIPAGMHGRAQLQFFAPFGNGYLPHVYNVSGDRNIWIGLGSQGHWEFGSPSFYNPTFYPFSDWTTNRTGEVHINVDLGHGRADWIAEKARAERERSFPIWRGYWENFLYLAFSQSWPDNDLHTVMGWLTVWMRWIWMPLVVLVAVGAKRRRFRGPEWLLPASALGVFLYMLVQHDGVMEGRYRKPVDAVFVASAIVMAWRWRTQPGTSLGTPPAMVPVAEAEAAPPQFLQTQPLDVMEESAPSEAGPSEAGPPKAEPREPVPPQAEAEDTAAQPA